MRFALFCHSLVSDWNHGNAHFLRGVTAELLARGHDVRVYEPHDAWSARQLVRHEGRAALDAFARSYPHLRSTRYRLEQIDLDEVLEGVDVVLVHEWSPLELVHRLAEHRHASRRSYLLMFHDTHHRAVSAPAELERYPLAAFDGALVFGKALADVYRARSWTDSVWVWHEAADLRVYRQRPPHARPARDVVWIGNWGDGERTRELEEYLFRPARELRLHGSVYGVRYPLRARLRLWRAGLRYRGWTANHAAPALYHRHRFTVHVPRRFYAEALGGIPTIRVFEALASGVPLISAPWSDSERLFETGRDFLMARDGREMREHMRMLRADDGLARSLAAHGRRTVEARHTCAHRVDELLGICAQLRGEPAAASARS